MSPDRRWLLYYRTTRERGSDIMGQDLNIPELEVVSVREASGSCPAGQDQNPR